MEQSYSDTIRVYIESLHNGAISIAKDDEDLLKAIESFYFKNTIEAIHNSENAELDRTNIVVNSFAVLQLLTDMYMFLKFLACTAHINADMIDLRDYVTQAINQEIYDLTLDQPMYIVDFMETSIRFAHMSKLQKYLYFCLLDADEVDTLSIYNPLFESEYWEYNYELDPEFLLTSIDEMRKINTYQNVLKEVVSILMTLYDINEDYTIFIFSDMIEMLNINPDEFFDKIDEQDQDYLYTKLKEYVEMSKEFSVVTK